MLRIKQFNINLKNNEVHTNKTKDRKRRWKYENNEYVFTP